MDAVLRGVAIYGFLLVLFQVAGKRSLAQMTPFDFVLLLIIGESTQQALLGNDFSVFNAFVVISTLILADVVVSLVKARSPLFAKVTEGVPMIVVEEGKELEDRMRKARIDRDDILQSARELQGVGRIEDIKYAVLERSGGISIIPRK